MHYDNGPTGPLTYAIIRRIMTAARTAGAFHFANVRYLMSEIRYYPEFLHSAGLSHSLLPTQRPLPRNPITRFNYEAYPEKFCCYLLSSSLGADYYRRNYNRRLLVGL